MSSQTDDTPVREQALKRLRKKQEFTGHLFAYVTVNAFLIAIWALTSGGLFWPAFPLFGWGIGILLHAWDVYRGEPSEEEIRKEMARMK